MLSEDNSSYQDASLSHTEIAIPRIIRFWMILLFYPPSIICSVFVLYHFTINRKLRRALHNHVIILLLFINLIVQLTSILWILDYYYTGYAWSQTPSFCLTWVFIDEALYITTTLLFSWATIERHILIFHNRFISTKYGFIFLHCLPIVVLLIYCICYNIIVVIIPPCDNTFDYNQLVCGYPLCYYGVHSLAMWDIIVNDLLPSVIIIFFSMALLLRVLYQKHQVRQPIRWRKHRKMTIQLLSISVLYLLIYIPEMLMEFIYLCGVSEDVGADFVLYAEFIAYYGNLLLPFICGGSMPELRKKLKKILPCCRRQRRAVGPQTFTMPKMTGVRWIRPTVLPR